VLLGDLGYDGVPVGVLERERGAASHGEGGGAGGGALHEGAAVDVAGGLVI
jgi:hypothetical protein